MRDAIIGGSFDPPTQVHLMVGEIVCHLVDRVIYVPAGHSPLKDGHRASAVDRLNMIRIATRGNPHFEVCDREVHREGRSYMLDTLRWFRAERGVEPVLVIGSDCYRELHRWSRYDELLAEFELIVVSRPGYDARNRSLAGVSKRGVTFLAGCNSGLSSTIVRRRLAAGSSCRYLVPDGVLRYIGRRRLYSPDASGDESAAGVGGESSAGWWARFFGG